MIKHHVVAVVPAAGVGKRFGGTVRKTFVELKGLPLVLHTLSRLSDMNLISEIIPVFREDDIDTARKLLFEHKLDKVKHIATGGKERQDSINNALKLIDDNCIIMVHDGARPVVSGALVNKLLENLHNADGVIPGLPVKETLKEVDSGGMVISTVDRDRFRSIQTPQAFTSDILKRAYEKAYADNYLGTDDASLVERAGGKIKIIEGDPYNIKVTTQEDIELIETFLQSRN